MHSHVPLARRNMLADPRRLIAGAVTVGLAIMLILLLDGLWTGIKRSVTAYEDHVGADLYVAQSGTRNFFGAVSQIPRSTVDVIRLESGVNWASPVRTFLAIISLHDQKVPASIIGWEPGEHGGPWEISQGRAPESDNEIAIGRVMADRHRLRIGDSLDVMGQTFQIVGTSSDTFMLSFVFMTHAATDSILDSKNTTSFVLVGTDRADQVRTQLESGGLTVRNRDELATQDLAVMTRAYKIPMGVMRGVAFAIGILVIALCVYTAIMDRSREYGIIKAMGATRRDLVSLALRQTFIVASAGFIAGSMLFTVGRAVISSIRPQFSVVLTTDTVTRAIIAAVLMALVAAALPANRLARIEPATAYRGG
ncbi:MAG: ABC transporter permease [Ilumatobacteraceae bacterium]